MMLIYKNPTPSIKTLHNLQLQIFPSHDIKRLLTSDRVLEFLCLSVERTTVIHLHEKEDNEN